LNAAGPVWKKNRKTCGEDPRTNLMLVTIVARFSPHRKQNARLKPAASDHGHIVAEISWSILGEIRWSIVAEIRWYIYASEFTPKGISGCSALCTVPGMPPSRT